MKKLSHMAGLLALVILLGLIGMHPHGNPDSYPKSQAVLISNEHGSCSGEQVQAPSGVDYILTASHCRLLMDKEGNFDITKEDGSVLKRRFIAEDPKSDLMLIEGLPGQPGLKIAKSADAGIHIRTYTHGAGFKTYRTDGHIIDRRKIQVPVFEVSDDLSQTRCEGSSKFKIYDEMFNRLCVMEEDVNVTEALIIPGSSGGMALNDSNELVGVASAAGGSLGFLSTVEDINAFLSGY